MIWRPVARALHSQATMACLRGRAAVMILTEPRRWLVAGLVTLTVVVGLTSSVAAAALGTVGFSIAGSATAEVPFSIVVSGTSAQEGTLLVYVLSGSLGCPAEASQVQGGDLHNAGVVSAGSYSKTVGDDIGAGTYTLCGYLTGAGAGGTYAAGADTFQVAPASAPTLAPSPTLSGPPAPVPNPTPAAPHLTTLGVTTRSHTGSTAPKPGETELLVSVTPDANLRVVFKRHGHTLTKRLSFGANSFGKVIVPWSCSAPGGVYGYTITATDAYGASLTRMGKFRSVSAARCRVLRLAGQHERQEQEAANHRAAEREAREERSPRHRLEVGEAEYCERVLNGDPEESFTAAGHVYTRCARVAGEVVVVGEGVVG